MQNDVCWPTFIFCRCPCLTPRLISQWRSEMPKIYQRFGSRPNHTNSLRHFAHPSLTSTRSKSVEFCIDFQPQSYVTCSGFSVKQHVKNLKHLSAWSNIGHLHQGKWQLSMSVRYSQSEVCWSSHVVDLELVLHFLLYFVPTSVLFQHCVSKNLHEVVKQVHIAIITSWHSSLEFTLFNSSNKCRTKTKTADMGYDDIIYTPAVAIF